MAFPKLDQQLGSRMPTSMKRLRELTEHLPSFPTEIGPEMPGWKEHKMLQGTSLAQNVLNIPQISAARWFNSKGSEFPFHHHAQKEWIIVISGSLTLVISRLNEDDEEKRLEWGDFAFLEPETIHKVVFDEDCWYLAITIPRSADWPTG